MHCSRCDQPIEEDDAYRAHGSNAQHYWGSADGCILALVRRVADLERKIAQDKDS